MMCLLRCSIAPPAHARRSGRLPARDPTGGQSGRLARAYRAALGILAVRESAIVESKGSTGVKSPVPPRKRGALDIAAFRGYTAGRIETGTRAMEQSAEGMLEELQAQPGAPRHAPTMGAVGKVRYTHSAMIDMIIAHPEASQNQIAEYFGYTAAWVSNIMASDAFKEQMAQRRTEIVDPSLRDLVERRFEALTVKSLEVLMHKLEAPQVSDAVALKAAELGARSLGFGQAAPSAPPPTTGNHLEQLAERLVSLQSRVRRQAYGSDGREVEDAEVIEGRAGPAATDASVAVEAAVSNGD